jgi:sulfate adenylyltransferase large subunit
MSTSVVQSGLVRLITCGSVDDGKSTLIGRLLYDTKSVFEDQLQAVERASVALGQKRTDLALLTDGLRAEREQGITIDVAYRYFATQRRRYILADCPGHVQYTRNMATGASTADVAVILIDARNGVVEQTRRHACICALLGVGELIVCVNKMDLVNYAQETFERIRNDFMTFANSFRPDGARGTTIAERCTIDFLPIAALGGDNIVARSTAMPWYGGRVLLERLDESIVRDADPNAPARMPVQIVIRPREEAHHDYRGIAGSIASGTFSVGDDVRFMPSGLKSRIAAINIGARRVTSATAPASIAMELEHDLDVSRGDLAIVGDWKPKIGSTIRATVVWMSATALEPGRRVVVKHAAKTTTATIERIEHRIDMSTGETIQEPAALDMNEIGGVTLTTDDALACASYAECRVAGAFIIIDERTNDTTGAGLINEVHS